MQLTLIALLSLLLAVAEARVVPRVALGNLGGAAPPVTNSGDSERPFEVNGNTFVNEAAAIQRSCDIQQNACMNAFNANSKGAGFTQADCAAQQQQCNAQTSTSTSGGASGSSTGSSTGSAASSSASTAVAGSTGSTSGTGTTGSSSSGTGTGSAAASSSSAAASGSTGSASGTGSTGSTGTSTGGAGVSSSSAAAAADGSGDDGDACEV